MFTTKTALPDLEGVERVYMYTVMGRSDIDKDKPLFKKLKGLNQETTNKIVDFNTYKQLSVINEGPNEEIDRLTLRTMQIQCSKKNYCLDPQDSR